MARGCDGIKSQHAIKESVSTSKYKGILNPMLLVPETTVKFD